MPKNNHFTRLRILDAALSFRKAGYPGRLHLVQIPVPFRSYVADLCYYYYSYDYNISDRFIIIVIGTGKLKTLTFS